MRKVLSIFLAGIIILSLQCVAAATPTQGARAPKRLEGKIIGVDAGHQQKPDYELEAEAPNSTRTKAKVSNGATGVVSRTPEYKINLLVALKLQKLLEAEGATVIMTRTKHDVNISNQERAAILNDAKCDAVIRIHCDGNTKSTVNGAHILTPSNPVNKAIHERSKQLGKSILEAFLLETGANSRGMRDYGDQTGFNWSKVPVVTIEMGYLTNPAEDALLNRDSYQNKCATGMLEGFVAYFEALEKSAA